MEETLPCLCPRLIPLTGWESQTHRRGKHPSQPGRLQTSLPGFAVQSTPGSTLQPRDQRMLSPPCRVLGQGLCWTGRVPPCCPGLGRTRTPGREDTAAAQPHFLVSCPPGIQLRRPFDLGAWQTDAGDRARITPCHLRPREGTSLLSHPPVGLPSDSSQGLGADGPVSAGSPGAPVTASSRDRSGPVPGTGTLLQFSHRMREQPRQRL